MKIIFDLRQDPDRTGKALTLGYMDKKYMQGEVGGKAREINLYIETTTTLPEFVTIMKQGIAKLNEDLAKNL